MDLFNSVGRISGPDGKFGGVGFLVTEGLFITSFYIVSRALGLDSKSPPPPESEVAVSFPFSELSDTITARTVHWSNDDGLASLAFTNKLPRSIPPVELAHAPDLWGHSFRTFGFPEDLHGDGLWGSGIIKGLLPSGRIQLDFDHKLYVGFGGAPVFDNTLKRVVGLIYTKYSEDIGFMIPGKTIAQYVGAAKIHETERVPVQVFLCHASQDNLAVRQLYIRLLEDGFIPWFYEEDLVPGQKWEEEIRKAVRLSDAIVVCLSSNAVSKSGFVQKEIKMALDVADEKPDGQIYIIPLRLQDCEVPDRLQSIQWVDLFEKRGYDRLKSSLSFVQRQR